MHKSQNEILCTSTKCCRSSKHIWIIIKYVCYISVVISLQDLLESLCHCLFAVILLFVFVPSISIYDRYRPENQLKWWKKFCTNSDIVSLECRRQSINILWTEKWKFVNALRRLYTISFLSIQFTAIHQLCLYFIGCACGRASEPFRDCRLPINRS